MNYMEIVLKVVSILGYTWMEYFGYKFRCGKKLRKITQKRAATQWLYSSAFRM